MATSNNQERAWAGPSVLPCHPAPDPARPRITIVYASSTGTAHDIAHRVAADLTRARFHTTTSSTHSYDPALLIHSTHTIFIIATTGQGDFPPSAHAFWNFFLRDGLPHDILSDLHTAVFGLGDSSYPRFCWPARKLTRRLHALGAHDLLSLEQHSKITVEADDQHPLGVEGALMPWLQHLYATLEEQYPASAQYPPIPDDLVLPPRVRVRLRTQHEPSSTPTPTPTPTPTADSSPTSSTYIPPGWQAAKLSRNERITHPSHFQDVRAIQWARSDRHPITYEPGDVACVLPENDPKDIERLLRRMKWEDHADSLVDLIPEGDETLPPHLPPHPITLRHLLTAYLSPLSIPRRSFFAFLRSFTPPSHLEHEKLTEFLTPGEGTDEMVDYAHRVRRNGLEVLEEFRGVQGVGVEWAVEMFGWMQERQFSIASAPAVSPHKIELAVAIVKYRTRLHTPRRGICTSWLERLTPGHVFPFRIERGTMRLPPSAETPIILVGPGTGVAPMRSLAHQRLAGLGWDVGGLIGGGTAGEEKVKEQGEGEGERPTLPNVQLFLGCRHSERDFLFGPEWARLSSATSTPSSTTASGSSRGLAYALAPSREREDGTKIYVQDKIRDLGRTVWDLLSDHGAYFYISGSSGKMPEAVREAVKAAVREHGGMDEGQAERYLEGLEGKGRWQEECWS
ncbi:unnamed protein product [Tilletia controversa]|uniref:NADPH-dependent diflavin oxidoreductase 1 n=1 Tax=Tilletia controversa TaxID=13291 RepID=A0A8X7STA6_9BASI|nr:hypothetical protein CF328_g7557 [Tilletia controversa]KAE8239583.1 hypothetical protein A4X06_0g8190 [Tilletia controversa]CAD6918227.1 unnamed protein product [Tilletia controversa]CAD6918839.1 unnamed protein product [Tilletia controversa]CAD6921535.1 unnamed protein product [Tilletia controversa]